MDKIVFAVTHSVDHYDAEDQPCGHESIIDAIFDEEHIEQAKIHAHKLDGEILQFTLNKSS